MELGGAGKSAETFSFVLGKQGSFCAGSTALSDIEL